MTEPWEKIVAAVLALAGIVVSGYYALWRNPPKLPADDAVRKLIDEAHHVAIWREEIEHWRKDLTDWRHRWEGIDFDLSSGRKLSDAVIGLQQAVSMLQRSVCLFRSDAEAIRHDLTGIKSDLSAHITWEMEQKYNDPERMKSIFDRALAEHNKDTGTP
jgi:hypothetical protein